MAPNDSHDTFIFIPVHPFQDLTCMNMNSLPGGTTSTTIPGTGVFTSFKKCFLLTRPQNLADPKPKPKPPKHKVPVP